MYVPNDHPIDVNKYRDLEYHKDWFSKQN